MNATPQSPFPAEPRHLIASSGRIVCLAWNDGKYGTTDGLGGSVIFRRSTDKGQTWHQELLLTSAPSGLSPKVDADDNIVAVGWENSGQSFRGISVRLSLDTGSTWSGHIPASDSSIQAGATDLSISNGNLYMVWSDARTGLSQIYLRSGRISTTGVVDRGLTLPSDLKLHPNYPNPFNATTIISYSISYRTRVSLSVSDILGREVHKIFDGTQDPGEFHFSFDATGLSSGVYFIRLVANQRAMIRPIMLIR